MKSFVFLLLLLAIVTSTTLFRINTNEVAKLNLGDTLISTLGYFKATLLQTNCVLSIESLTVNNTYVKVGNYTSQNVTGNCKSLTIIQGQVVTQTNSTYMIVGSSYNLSTILTIDDWGVIRLIGTYQMPNYVDQVSQQLTITTFKKNQTYVFPASQLTVNFNDMFTVLNNQRDWQFLASFGQLDIMQFSNNGISTSYSYARFTLNNSQIVDFNGNTFPSAIFPNISFKPRCVEPRLYLDFKPPFVFVADPNWPIFTLYEQGRYKVLQVSLSTVYQATAEQQDIRHYFRNQQSVCPPFTFQFNGTCVTTCPYPFYHQMRSQYGYCVLTCEQFTPKNETTRICSCFHKYQGTPINATNIVSCPSDALTYPYGCYCNKTGFYFDRKYTFSCVSICPETTFPNNGLCMNCPKSCKTCQIDKIYRSYLQCKICSTGYTLQNGQCIKSCSSGLGMSIVAGICQQCTDPNCRNCTQDVTICTQCSLLYILNAGTCIQTCSNTTTIVPYDDLQSVCMTIMSTCSETMASHYKNKPFLKCLTCNDANLYSHHSQCLQACPSGYIGNANKYCYCNDSSTLTVNDRCLKISSCPIEMGWDPYSDSCLSCNFGCLTCYNSGCTSCNPGYFLYVSPQGVRCRRKSPLFPCDQQYGWIQQICLVLNYNDPALGLTKCYTNIPNCKACYPQRDDMCSLCNSGYYNHNNTCVQTCPNGTIPYNSIVCILLQIINCSSPYLKINYEAFILNYDKLASSAPYTYYTFKGKQASNDPVGYIPSYQQLTQRKNDGQFRDSQFYHPVWTCLKCNDGYGMSDDFTSCLPCPDPCATCYMAKNISCLTVITNLGCQYYTDSITGACVQSCSSDSYIPNSKNGILYCSPLSSTSVQQYAKIDSSIFTAADGTNHIFFIFDQTISKGNISLPITKQTSVPLLSASSSGTPSNVQSASLQAGNFLTLHDSNPNNLMYILNMTNHISDLVSTTNLAFPNTVYGVSSQQSHPQFMKTWLAFIGQIMSIVIILLHVVFIGNDLLYKVDNTLILAQTIYYFSFVQLLVGKLLAQFYYGWIFAHFGFFPNFFANTIPSNYVELAAPNSYKLATLDANIVRNAGYALSLLIVFLGGFGFITVICWIISKVGRKPDIWHPKIAINSFIGGIQFLSMAIFYWSVANILYIKGADVLNSGFYGTSKSVSIFFIVIISVYTLVRWFFNPLGGLYMAKRILLATILAAAYNDKNYLAPLLLLQTVFTVLRYFMEGPEKKKQQIYLFFQYLIYVGTYLLLFLCMDAGVNTIIISIFMFVLIVILAYDLTDVYLESQNEWLLEDPPEQDSTDRMVKAQAEGQRRRSNIRSDVSRQN